MYQSSWRQTLILLTPLSFLDTMCLRFRELSTAPSLSEKVASKQWCNSIEIQYEQNTITYDLLFVVVALSLHNFDNILYDFKMLIIWSFMVFASKMLQADEKYYCFDHAEGVMSSFTRLHFLIWITYDKRIVTHGVKSFNCYIFCIFYASIGLVYYDKFAKHRYQIQHEFFD